MLFGSGGQPEGGKISNFLLEKSRVVMQNSGERNFHIFYQLCTGATDQMRSEYGITDLDYYYYLSYGGNHRVEGTNDGKEFLDTLHAMSVMGLTDDEQNEILKVTAAVLHFGNISFQENGNYASVSDKQCKDFYLFYKN